MMDRREKLNSMLSDFQRFHDNLQIDSFITVRNGGTPWGQYKQALRELEKRYRNLKYYHVDIQESLLNIEDLESKYQAAPEKFDVRRVRIKIARERMALEEKESVLLDCEREFERFFAQCCALKEVLGEITPEKRRSLDIEYWKFRLKMSAAVELLTARMLSKNTIEAITSLPDEIRNELLADIAKRKELTDWFETANVPMPDYSRHLAAIKGVAKSLIPGEPHACLAEKS